MEQDIETPRRKVEIELSTAILSRVANLGPTVERLRAEHLSHRVARTEGVPVYVAASNEVCAHYADWADDLLEAD